MCPAEESGLANRLEGAREGSRGQGCGPMCILEASLWQPVRWLGLKEGDRVAHNSNPESGGFRVIHSTCCAGRAQLMAIISRIMFH